MFHLRTLKKSKNVRTAEALLFIFLNVKPKLPISFTESGRHEKNARGEI